jgi:hypothetical protein
MTDLNITALVQDFATQLVAAIEASTAQRIQAAIAGTFGAPIKRSPGRPRQGLASMGMSAASLLGKRTRPKQFCPVPGCTNVAAPVFGMVCAEHKNVDKAKIKKYREERKATVESDVAAPAKRVRKMTPKLAKARKLQGQYLGALKGLKGADKARVKQTAKEKGVAEAVKLAASLRNG